MSESIQGVMPMKEILSDYGLDFTVTLEPIQTISGIVDRNHKATVRDNETILGIVGNRYEVIQNSEKFGILLPGIQSGEIRLVNGGAFREGRRVFLQAEVKDSRLVLNNDDEVKTYFTVASSHDGSLEVVVALTHIRIYCNNTFVLFVNQAKRGNCISLKHTKNSLKSINFLYERMKMIQVNQVLVKQAFERMNSVKLTEKQAFEYLERVFLKKNDEGEFTTRSMNVLEGAKQYLFSGKGQPEIPELNVWKVFNGATGFIQNQKLKFDNEMEKINSDVFGVSQNQTQACFDLALELIN